MQTTRPTSIIQGTDGTIAPVTDRGLATSDRDLRDIMVDMLVEMNAIRRGIEQLIALTQGKKFTESLVTVDRLEGVP